MHNMESKLIRFFKHFFSSFFLNVDAAKKKEKKRGIIHTLQRPYKCVTEGVFVRWGYFEVCSMYREHKSRKMFHPALSAPQERLKEFQNYT